MIRIASVFCTALGILFMLSCGSGPAETVEEESSTPDVTRVVVDLTAPVSQSSEFNTQNDGVIGSTSSQQWLEFEVDIPVAGRYRTEIKAVNTSSDTGAVWVEDYVDNPDGRTYNITGSMPVAQGTNPGSGMSTSRDGSPLNKGAHKIKVHFDSPDIFASELNFTLMIEHQETPEVLTQEMDGENWEIVWADEFDGTGLPDTSKWTFDVGDWGWGNNELQYYTDSDTRNARLEDGNLIIEAHKKDTADDWSSARLTTRGKTTFRYGKIEFRAKVPFGRGTWAAGWTLGDAYVDELSWPYCGEIDIMESVGYETDDETGAGKAHASVHCRAFYFKEGNHYTSTLDIEDIHNEYHTYGVIWTPEGITAYVDDQEYFEYNDTTDSRTWPFSEPQNIILNLAMGGGWGGAQGMEENLPSQRIYLDYVRVYERK